MEAKVYNREGKEAGTVELAPELFGLPWNADLVHQVVVSMQSNERQPIAHAKGRGDVSGGGKKPWRQKGTGRARHGSSRSPIWRGGGVTHGPTNERNYAKKINKKMKAKAFFTILSAKLRDNELIFVQDIVPSAIKTKEAQSALNNIAKAGGYEKLVYRSGNRALVAVPAASETAKKSFRNIPSVMVADVANLNPVDLMAYKYVVVSQPAESLEALVKRAK